MSNRPIIAIDVDEVLFPMHRTFVEHHNKYFGSNIEYPDRHGRYFLDQFLPDVDEIEFIRRQKAYIASDYFVEEPPIAGSVEGVNRLAEKYDLTVVTSRQEYIEKPTSDFLKRYYGSTLDNVHFTAHEFGKGMKIPKSEICKRIGATYMIDDNLLTALDCARAGIKTILFGDYHWNQADELPTGVVRCKDWQAVLEYFDV
jgi:5'(3')-deoxyribonucleotidase